MLILPEAAPSFAEVLLKYTLESKATTPNSHAVWSSQLLVDAQSWSQLHGSIA